MTANASQSQPNRKGIAPRLWLAVVAACIAGLTGLNGYRAATQSITHDEAVTYDRYVSGPLYKLVSSTDANNHVLNSVLCRCSVGIFGISEFTLRLPSVAAGFFFLVFVARIGWRVWGPSATPAVGVLLLGLNPFVLDYLSAARGYSFALMGWVAALNSLLAASQEPNGLIGAGGESRHLRRASQYLALSVLGNLTFAPAAVMLAACWVAWGWIERRRQVAETPAETREWVWRSLGRPGAIVFACLALPFVKLRPGSFYFGATSVTESMRSMVSASFAHHSQQWPFDTSAAWYQSLIVNIADVVIPVVALALIALWVVTVVVLRKGHESNRPGPGVMLFHLSAGTLGLTVAVIGSLHVFGMKLPHERTGLYLLPPLGLAFLSAGAAITTLRERVRGATLVGVGVARISFALAMLLCIVWGAQLQATHYRSWVSDSDSRKIFQAITAAHDPAQKRRLRVGATWGLAPALNFYRDRYKADFIERIERRNDYPNDVDLYVVVPAYGGKPPTEPIVVLYENSTTGTVLATPVRSGIPTFAVARRD